MSHDFDCNAHGLHSGLHNLLNSLKNRRKTHSIHPYKRNIADNLLF